MAAQVSGPGAYSKRTDTGGQPIRDMPDPKYGEATAYREQQKGAPLSNSSNAGPGAPYPSDIARAAAQPQVEQMGPGSSPEPAALPGLFDAGDPSIPVTAGAPMGPGPNSVTGGNMPAQPLALSQQLAQYSAGDGGDAIAQIANMLAQMGQ